MALAVSGCFLYIVEYPAYGRADIYDTNPKKSNHHPMCPVYDAFGRAASIALLFRLIVGISCQCLLASSAPLDRPAYRPSRIPIFMVLPAPFYSFVNDVRYFFDIAAKRKKTRPRELLRSVGQSEFRSGVYFDHKPVSARGDSRPRQRRYIACLASGVRRVYNKGKMALLFDDRYSAYIQRISR